jgi:hypothetical protein
MTDAQGNEVALKYVKGYDRERDRLARRILKRWQAARATLERIYAETSADLDTMERMAADGRKAKLGAKGNFQFTSFDGSIQVARKARYELRFDERLRVAQSIIEEIVKEKAEGVDEDLAEMVRGIFRPTSDGLLSQARVMGLFRLRIKHPRWSEAMDMIRESIEARRTNSILSVAERQAGGAWAGVLLDIAKVGDDAAQEGTI